MARRSSRLRQLTLFDAIAPTISAAKAGPSRPFKPPPRRQRKPRIQSSEDESVAGPSDKQAESRIPMAISEGSDDEPVENLPRPPTKRRRVQIVESDSDVESKPTKSRFKTGSKKLAGSEEESTAESLTSDRRRILKRKHSVTSDEVDEQRILPTRMRSRGKQTAFQKSLERLKLRKQTKIADIVSSDDDQHESDDSIIPFEGARPSGQIDSQDETSDSDSDTSNFIVEDDDAVPELPIEFSMESHQDLSFQFKKIFQFFVHIAVNSPIDRHDYMKRQMKHEEYFSVPLNTTRRKLLGLRDSLVASSIWSAEFKRTLEKYANFEIVPLDFAIPYCDACHFGGRMSTLIGRVTGRYDAHI